MKYDFDTVTEKGELVSNNLISTVTSEEYILWLMDLANKNARNFYFDHYFDVKVEGHKIMKELDLMHITEEIKDYAEFP